MLQPRQTHQPLEERELAITCATFIVIVFSKKHAILCENSAVSALVLVSHG